MFVTMYDPPQKRKSRAVGGIEERLTEAAVMLAMAFYVIEENPSSQVAIYPDGEHGKRFDIPAWLDQRGFVKVKAIGSTAYGGTYRKGRTEIVVNPKPGVGDVVGEINGQRIHVECKGGTINTTHSGQVSKMRRGLCEAVGLLMCRKPDGAREIAAVPLTQETERLARRMRARCTAAGIEIALVRKDGSILWANNLT
jgi:hypothetical protein